MSISAYQQSIFKSRAIPFKASQAAEERQLMALEMASSQLTALIAQMTSDGQLIDEDDLTEGQKVVRRLFIAKREAIQDLMTQLGTGISGDISDTVKSVTEETTAFMEGLTEELLSEEDQEIDLSNFAGIPQTVMADYANRVDVEGLKISPNIWANSQTALIENQVMAAIVRGQSAISLARNLEKFVLGGSIGMGHSIRYKTMRLARTEINTAYHESRRLTAITSPVVQGMQWRLSNRHPKWDVCDLLADQDLYQMGKGVYPPGQLPPKPHPNCICYTMDDLRDPVLWDSPKPEIALKGDPSQFRPEGIGTERYIDKQYQLFVQSVEATEAAYRLAVPVVPVDDFTPAGTVAEAEAWALSKGIKGRWSHPAAQPVSPEVPRYAMTLAEINECQRELDRLMKEYPDVRVDSIGSFYHDDLTRWWESFEAHVETDRREYKGKRWRRSEAEKRVRKTMLGEPNPLSKHGAEEEDGTYSVFKAGEWEFRSYSLRVNHVNTFFQSIEQEGEERSAWIADQAASEEGLTEREARSLRRRKKSGLSNVTGSYRGITAHEFGHALQDAYGLVEVPEWGPKLTYNPKIQDLFD